MPQSQSQGHPSLSFGVCVCFPEFPLAPALRQQHGHHDLFRSLSSELHWFFLLSPIAFRTPPQPFSIPLDTKFGSFVFIFEVFCTLSPAPPCHTPLSPSVLTWKERMHCAFCEGWGNKWSQVLPLPSPSFLSKFPHSNKSFPPNIPPPTCSLDKYIYMVCITLLIKCVLIMRCN